MSTLTLNLHEKVALAGGAIEFTDSIAHRGQAPVARFHAWIGEEYREVELRVGDKACAGDVAFELRDIAPERAGTTIAFTQLTGAAAVRDIAFQAPFEIGLGGCVKLPSGQLLKFTGIGRYGLEVLFTDRDDCENFTWFDFGFWREDGLLLEVETTDLKRASARLCISPEDLVNQRTDGQFGAVVQLRPRSVVELPDGAQLKLRRAKRQSYDAVDWHLYAEKGDSVTYPYESLTTSGDPASVYDRSFRLLGRRYLTRPAGQQLEGDVALLLTVDPETLASFVLGEPFDLELSSPRQGPDGLVVQYHGTAHGHGTMMGPDNEEIPFTDAWAEFAVVKGDVTSRFTVDLMDFEAAEESLFGFRFTVTAIVDHRATLRVDRRR